MSTTAPHLGVLERWLLEGAAPRSITLQPVRIDGGRVELVALAAHEGTDCVTSVVRAPREGGLEAALLELGGELHARAIPAAAAARSAAPAPISAARAWCQEENRRSRR